MQMRVSAELKWQPALFWFENAGERTTKTLATTLARQKAALITCSIFTVGGTTL